jgi:hypothetical protein
VPARAFSDEQLDAAVAAIAQEDRLRAAQDLVARTAPALQRILAAALADGGWFGAAHEEAVAGAAAEQDPGERERRVRTLIAEETRLGMLVGVAVGYELAQELNQTTQED